MTASARRHGRAERSRRRRKQAAIAGGVALALAVGLTVFLVGFRDDDAPAVRRSARSTSTTSATPATTAAGSTVPSQSTPPDTTPPPATTAVPALASAPLENVNASGVGCGGDDQPAIAGTWQTTAPRTPAGGGDVDLALRQQDGSPVAGLPITAVVTAPGRKTFAANPIAVAPKAGDATVAFPKDFPAAGRFRLDENAGDYSVRWQTLGGSALACDHFQVG